LDSFIAGAHVIFQNPATPAFEKLDMLVWAAREAGRDLV
jgi:hypothetical protein